MSTVKDFVTTGHHTFENRNSPNDVNNAPFKCKDVNAFLGRGYYFWDDNLALAKWWGGVRYIDDNKQYYVGERSIECERKDVFDLIGDRQHQKFILEVADKLGKRREGKQNWPIGKIIEFLKAVSKDPDENYYQKFGYKAIRAADDSFTKQAKRVEFAENMMNFADLNPCYIICVIDEKEILLAPLFIVHKSEQKEKK